MASESAELWSAVATTSGQLIQSSVSGLWFYIGWSLAFLGALSFIAVIYKMGQKIVGR